MQKPSSDVMTGIAAALVATAVALFYLFSEERDFAADLAKALFGLSGGNTAGG
jgi:hypothetical protein